MAVLIHLQSYTTLVEVYLLVVAALTGLVFATVGFIDPLDPVVNAGTDLNLTCTLDSNGNGNYTADDILWYRYSSELPKDTYNILDDTASRIALSNVTFEDGGNYVCRLPGDNFLEQLVSVLAVGVQPEPPLVECFIRNLYDFWCEWASSKYTNLRESFKFDFKKFGTSDWKSCPDTITKGPNTCLVLFKDNPDTRLYVRVNSTNALGAVYTEKYLDLYNDVVVNPPRNVVLNALQEETSITVSWFKPEEWSGYPGELEYMLRFSTTGACSLDNPSCWQEVNLGMSTALVYTLKNLESYTDYTVQLAARFGLDNKNWSLWSPVKTACTRETAPTSSVTNLNGYEIDNADDPVYKRDAHLTWENVPATDRNGLIIGYKVLIYKSDTPPIQEATNQTWIVLTALEKFYSYTLDVVAYSSIANSPKATLFLGDKTAAPNPPSQVTYIALSTTSIMISWEKPSDPKGYVLNYVVQWSRADSNSGLIESHRTNNSNQLSYVAENLDTYVSYDFGVKTKNSVGESGTVSVEGGTRTLEGVPDAAPTDIVLAPITNQDKSLSLVWQPVPIDKVNGDLSGYLIFFCESSLHVDYTDEENRCSGGQRERNVTRPDAMSYVLDDLVPQTEYTVWLAAYTRVGSGPTSEPVIAETSKSRDEVVLISIFVPLAVIIIVLMILTCFWQKISQFMHPLPDPKFASMFKNNSNDLFRSNGAIKIEKEQFDEIIMEACDIAEEDPLVTSADPIFCSTVSIDLKKQIVSFHRSVSCDSGLPPSPSSDSPDFSMIRDNLHWIEDEDSSTLPPEERSFPYIKPEKLSVTLYPLDKMKNTGEGSVPSLSSITTPSSPVDSLGAYTQVGLVPAPKPCPSSPVKSLSPDVQLASPKVISPYTQMSNVNCSTQSTNREGISHRVVNVVDDTGKNRSSPAPNSSIDVLPYIEMKPIATTLPKLCTEHRKDTNHTPSPPISSYIEMSAVNHVKSTQQESSVNSVESNGLPKLTLTVTAVLPSDGGKTTEDTVPALSPPVSPYIELPVVNHVSCTQQKSCINSVEPASLLKSILTSTAAGLPSDKTTDDTILTLSSPDNSSYIQSPPIIQNKSHTNSVGAVDPKVSPSDATLPTASPYMQMQTPQSQRLNKMAKDAPLSKNLSSDQVITSVGSTRNIPTSGVSPYSQMPLSSPMAQKPMGTTCPSNDGEPSSHSAHGQPPLAIAVLANQIESTNVLPTKKHPELVEEVVPHDNNIITRGAASKTPASNDGYVHVSSTGETSSSVLPYSQASTTTTTLEVSPSPAADVSDKNPHIKDFPKSNSGYIIADAVGAVTTESDQAAPDYITSTSEEVRNPQNGEILVLHSR